MGAGGVVSKTLAPENEYKGVLGSQQESCQVLGSLGMAGPKGLVNSSMLGPVCVSQRDPSGLSGLLQQDKDWIPRTQSPAGSRARRTPKVRVRHF